MIIDKTNKFTKIMAVLCAISAVVGAVLTIQYFVLYRFIILLANIALAFVCIKGIGKDREICVGVYGLIAIFEIANIFMDSLTVSTAMIALLKILCYILLVAYYLGYITDRWIPLTGGIIVTLLPIKNIYNLIAAYIELQKTMDYLGGNGSTFFKSMLTSLVGIITYIIPPITATVLIACNAIKFKQKEN